MLTENENLVTSEDLKALCALFNLHDLDSIMTYFTDDIVLVMPRGPHPWGQRFEGLEQVRAGLASRFAGLPDVHYGDDCHWISQTGDRGISEWVLTGTTLDGESIRVHGCDHWTFRGDRISRKDSYWKIVE